MTTDSITDRMNEIVQRNRRNQRNIAKLAGKTVRQMEREAEKSCRCSYCGAHGHKASKCPNK
jgi:hypothetical protein